MRGACDGAALADPKALSPIASLGLIKHSGETLKKLRVEVRLVPLAEQRFNSGGELAWL